MQNVLLFHKSYLSKLQQRKKKYSRSLINGSQHTLRFWASARHTQSIRAGSTKSASICKSQSSSIQNLWDGETKAHHQLCEHHWCQEAAARFARPFWVPECGVQLTIITQCTSSTSHSLFNSHHKPCSSNFAAQIWFFALFLIHLATTSEAKNSHIIYDIELSMSVFCFLHFLVFKVGCLCQCWSGINVWTYQPNPGIWCTFCVGYCTRAAVLACVKLDILFKSKMGISKSKTPASAGISVFKMPSHCRCPIMAYKVPSIYAATKVRGWCHSNYQGKFPH